MKKRKIAVLIGLFACALLALGLAGCEHEHTYGAGWTYDATHHWHEATCEHTGEKDGYAEHTWDGGTVTTAATCTEAGEKTYTCTVCSATKTEVIAATGHTYAEEWSSDNTHHWHEATCEHSEETEGKAEHAWDSGTVTTAATCTEGGVMTYTCTVCDATKQQTIPATGHTYAEGWTTTTTHHWHAATCEHSDEQEGYGEHTYDENKVCTVCNMKYVSAGLEYTLSGDSTYYSVTGIGACTDTEIYIPATYQGIPVKEIGAHAFYENTTITGVVLPDSITTISDSAFDGCTVLASINLPEGLTTIGEGAFNSVSIASIVIPASVTTIPDWAFSGCSSLTSVTIGSGVTSIGDFVSKTSIV